MITDNLYTKEPELVKYTIKNYLLERNISLDDLLKVYDKVLPEEEVKKKFSEPFISMLLSVLGDTLRKKKKLNAKETEGVLKLIKNNFFNRFFKSKKKLGISC